MTCQIERKKGNQLQKQEIVLVRCFWFFKIFQCCRKSSFASQANWPNPNIFLVFKPLWMTLVWTSGLTLSICPMKIVNLCNRAFKIVFCSSFWTIFSNCMKLNVKPCTLMLDLTLYSISVGSKAHICHFSHLKTAELGNSNYQTLLMKSAQQKYPNHGTRNANIQIGMNFSANAN